MAQEDTFSINGYKKIDDFIRNVEKKKLTSDCSVINYSTDAVNKRLAQKITAVITDPYLRKAISHYRSTGNFPEFKNGMCLAGIYVHSENSICPSAKLVLKCLISFFYFGLM